MWSRTLSRSPFRTPSSLSNSLVPSSNMGPRTARCLPRSHPRPQLLHQHQAPQPLQSRCPRAQHSLQHNHSRYLDPLRRKLLLRHPLLKSWHLLWRTTPLPRRARVTHRDHMWLDHLWHLLQRLPKCLGHRPTPHPMAVSQHPCTLPELPQLQRPQHPWLRWQPQEHRQLHVRP